MLLLLFFFQPNLHCNDVAVAVAVVVAVVIVIAAVDVAVAVAVVGNDVVQVELLCCSELLLHLP